jgi:hypothetical protein
MPQVGTHKGVDGYSQGVLVVQVELVARLLNVSQFSTHHLVCSTSARIMVISVSLGTCV